MSKHNGSGVAYAGEVCDKCEGPTLAFASGSIWCPSEACTPGGHFVKRVAFERAPKNMDELREKTVRKQRPTWTPKPVKPQVPVDPYAVGMDSFIKKS